MRSNVIVGLEENEGLASESCGDDLKLSNELKFKLLKHVSKAGEEADEPDMSMEAAAEVVDAMVAAETGSGWL